MCFSPFQTGDFPWVFKDLLSLNPCLFGLKLVMRESRSVIYSRDLTVIAGYYQHRVLVLSSICNARAGPGLMPDLCSPATESGELRYHHPMGPFPSGWLHNPSRGWEYCHRFTAAFRFLKPFSLLFFSSLLIIEGAIPGYRSHSAIFYLLQDQFLWYSSYL